MSFSPFTIHEASIAIWHSHDDGFPVLHPETNKPIPGLFAHCKSSISITETIAQNEAALPGEWRGTQEPSGESSWQINIESAFGQIMADGDSRNNTQHRGGSYIIVVKWLDEETSKGMTYQFHHATLSSQGPSTSGETMNEGAQFSASHLEFFPSEISSQINGNLTPLIVGRVEWSMAGITHTCLSQDPLTGDWQEWAENQLPSGDRRVYFGPPETPDNSLHLSYLSYEFSSDPTSAHPNRNATTPVKRTAFIIKQEPDSDKGMFLTDHHQLQTKGCPEVLIAPDRYTSPESPTVTFRYLRRVYATIQNKVIALPQLAQNQIPQASDQPFFHLRDNGAQSPENRSRGLTITPVSGFLDGTVTHS
jgi:hypothetical protein